MAGIIPERVLEEIRFRNDIVEIIGERVPLKRSGATYKACCPFHKEKTPSFNVNPNQQYFKCFGCGEGGDVITFVMKSQGMDFMTAVRYLAERAHVDLEVQEDHGEGALRKKLYAVHEGIARFYRRCLDEYPGAEHARKYVQERGLDDEVAAAFGVGYAPGGWHACEKWAEKNGYETSILLDAGLVLSQQDRDGVYDRFRDRLMFPIRDIQGRVVGFSGRLLNDEPRQPKYVNSPETMIFKKSRVLFGMDQARQSILEAKGREAIICEGQVDVIRCHQKGLTQAVAAQGTAFTEEHVGQLKRYADSAVLFYDADGAGQTAAIKTARLLMQAGLVVRVADLPEGDDPDTFLVREGREAAQALIEAGRSVVAFQIKSLAAGERDMRDVATTQRIAGAVLETIAAASHAVQRERLLQEASAQLNLSVETLQSDLNRVSKQMSGSRQRTTRAEETTAVRTEARAKAVDPRTSGRKRILAGIAASEQLLCQVLLQYEGDQAILTEAEHCLEATLIQHELPRKLYLAIMQAKQAGVSLDEWLAEQEGEDVKVLEQEAQRIRQLMTPVCSGEATSIDALHDVLLRIWQAHLKHEAVDLVKRADLDAKERYIQYEQIMRDLDVLNQNKWESAQDIILMHLAIREELGDLKIHEETVESAPPEADSEA